MSALSRVVRSGVGRRKVQTVVIGLATMLAVAASVLSGSLLVASNDPFETAFDEQHGSHLTAAFDASSVTAEQLAGTGDVDGVVETSGPYETATITPDAEVRFGEDAPAVTMTLPPLKVVGRDEPGGGVDNVTLMDGRWAGSGEIVLSVDGDRPADPIGTTYEVPDLQGAPTLTVVGWARSVSGTADAWVAPSTINQLTSSGTPTGYQMLYRVLHPDDADDITAVRDAIASATPDGALIGAHSWLAVKEDVTKEISVYVPFLVAFGVVGLALSVLIVGNVVAGAVSSGRRRIGVLKALGFTPRQVVRAYVGQALIPAAVGAMAGVVIGWLLAVPILSEAQSVYSTVGLRVEPWLTVAVSVFVLVVVGMTAYLAARPAGRLRTVDALAVGRKPSTRRGRFASRVGAILPVPRPVSLGVTRPFARPAQALTIASAVAFGILAVTFSTGLASSLNQVHALRPHNGADASVFPGYPRGEAPPAPEGEGPITRSGPAADSGVAGPAPAPEVADIIAAQSGTQAYYGTANTRATAAGLPGVVDVVAFRGDASWGGFEMLSGRWLDGAGEAVVPTGLLNATGSEVGDVITLTVAQTSIPVRIVGEMFTTQESGRLILTDIETLADAMPDLQATTYRMAVKPGVDVADYVASLNNALTGYGVTAEVGFDPGGSESELVVAMTALASMLTLVLIIVAALGVLNGVVLDTRERVRDIGVFKALGMLPRQTMVMVVMSVLVSGLIGGLIGVPLGVALHAVIMPAMGNSVGLTLPGIVVDVFSAPQVALFTVAGVGVAIVGALLPAGWAAKVSTATALRTE